MKNKTDIDSRVKIYLRRLFLKSEYRNDKLKAARYERGKYRCDKCGETFKCGQLQVHHIDEVADSNDWNEYIAKMFCSQDRLLAVCKSCHNMIHGKK